MKEKKRGRMNVERGEIIYKTKSKSRRVKIEEGGVFNTTFVKVTIYSSIQL